MAFHTRWPGAARLSAGRRWRARHTTGTAFAADCFRVGKKAFNAIAEDSMQKLLSSVVMMAVLAGTSAVGRRRPRRSPASRHNRVSKTRPAPVSCRSREPQVCLEAGRNRPCVTGQAAAGPTRWQCLWHYLWSQQREPRARQHRRRAKPKSGEDPGLPGNKSGSAVKEPGSDASGSSSSPSGGTSQ
jgi:hypothetical protein